LNESAAVCPDTAYRRYLRVVFLSLLVLSVPLCTNFIFLRHADEITGYPELIRRQRDQGTLYGSGLNSTFFRYKLQLVRDVRPDVIAVGSSRVMQFQTRAFRASFVNAGGAANTLNETRMFLDEMFRFHRPKLILMVLEFYLFNSRFFEPDSYPDHFYDETEITRDKLLSPFAWLATGKVPPRLYAQIVLGDIPSARGTRWPAMGINAIENAMGFYPDGSYFYGGFFQGLSVQDVKFSNTLERIHEGKRRFEYGTDIDAKRISELREIIAVCRQNKVQLILFLPPVAPAVLRCMQEMSEQYQYVDRLNTYLRSLDIEYYDFRDARSLGGSDCEFIDGFHAGNTMHYRMLQWVLKNRPHSALIPYLNAEVFSPIVAQYTGHAMVPEDPGKLNFKEVDFLQIGCSKDSDVVSAIKP